MVKMAINGFVKYYIKILELNIIFQLSKSNIQLLFADEDIQENVFYVLKAFTCVACDYNAPKMV